MGQSNKLIFVTHNKGKVESANKYFEGQLEFQPYDYEFREIRSESIEEIAIAKVLEAYEMTKMPTIAMDAGVYVEKLRGFPGVYVHHFLSTIGIEGLLKLMIGEDERKCCFKQCLAFYDGKGRPKIFYGEHKGIVSREARGTLSKHDWSELSYIFIPDGKEHVLAEMTDDERTAFLKENDSAFMHFKEWYIDYLASEEYYEKKRLDLSWKKTCVYMEREGLMDRVSFETWIKPLKLADSREECLFFTCNMDEFMFEIFRCALRKYEKLIIAAYNHCNLTRYKAIKINFSKI